jgi:hypothetical protein
VTPRPLFGVLYQFGLQMIMVMMKMMMMSVEQSV